MGFVKTTAWETKFQKALGVCSRLCYSYLLSHVQLFATPGTIAHQAPLSMGILHTRILEWVACPPAGDLRNPWIKPKSPALKEHPLASEPPGKLNNALVLSDSLRPHGQAPLPWGFFRQEYWSGLPCPPPGIYPTQVSCIVGGSFTI